MEGKKKADGRKPVIGLIVPPASGEVPSDAERLYPNGPKFIAVGLALGAITPEGYDAVIDSAAEKARRLRAAGADVVSLMGTSLTFYRGAAFNRDLQAAMREASGLPSTTMSSAVVRALRALGVRRVGLATAYIDEVTRRLGVFLGEEGFTVTTAKGLSVTDVNSIQSVTPETLRTLSEEVFAADPSADGLLISCGGLLTLDVLEPLESRLGVPVIASSPAGFWDVVRLAGLDPRTAGYGRLFELPEEVV
ncbi:MAG: aspartate/glutamate racemase family protein [Deltaproteobacteria bacterium]|nr:aspartate/glutamate racemase family protein [Deltaproteobacteria bacterium]